MSDDTLLFSVRSEENEKKIVADKAIPTGTELCFFSGPIIDYDVTKDLGEKESYALQVSKNCYHLLDPPFRYFNHSCDPNCGLMPDLKLITIKPARQGEELTYDYSTTMMERDWKMKCSCGKPNCRKIITDFDKLPADLQQKYLDLNIVQEYIVKALKK
jgi:hypothetical protein